MPYIKLFDQFSHTNSLTKKYGNIINTLNVDIENINYILDDIKDIGYYAFCDYTPLTLTLNSKKPKVFVSIQKDIKMKEFYGNKLENKNIVESTIESCIEYINIKGYSILNKVRLENEFQILFTY